MIGFMSILCVNGISVLMVISVLCGSGSGLYKLGHHGFRLIRLGSAQQIRVMSDPNPWLTGFDSFGLGSRWSDPS